MTDAVLMKLIRQAARTNLADVTANETQESKRSLLMRKYKWLFIGITVLFLTVAVIFIISSKLTNSMGSGCVDDGSCCADEKVCACE